MTDKEALARIAEGNLEYFWILWAIHQEHFFRMCKRLMSGDYHAAEDALNTAMLRAYTLLPAHVEKIQNIRPWLARLVHNVCMDLHKEQKKQMKIKDSLMEDIRNTSNARGNSSEEAYIRTEELETLESAIMRLPIRYREAFVMRDFYKLRYRKIAEQLEITSETARKRTQLGRRMLKQSLEQNLQKLFFANKNTDLFTNIDPEIFIIPLPNREKPRPEIALPSGISWPVRICLKNGLELNAYVMLPEKPTREEMKIRTLRRYVSEHPSGWKKRLQLANLLYATGAWEEAIDHYYWVLERRTQHESALRLSNILLMLGRFNEAVVLYEKMAKQLRQEASRFHIEGLLEIRKNNVVQAVSAFENAIRCAPENSAHWYELGALCKTPQRILRIFRKILGDPPDNSLIVCTAYDAYVCQGYKAEAESLLMRAREKNPNDVLLLRREIAARLQTEQIRHETGRQTHNLIKQFLRLNPHSPDGFALEAQYYIVRKNQTLGLDILKNFIRQYPNNPRGFYHYAVWLYFVGDIATANLMMQAARRLFQGNPNIINGPLKPIEAHSLDIGPAKLQLPPIVNRNLAN